MNQKDPLIIKNRNPWAWVPTLYFAQGIPYVVVMTVAVIMYKRLGISNTDIALYTSWLYLPWVIKPFWSPFVDLIKTKRWWVTIMQLLIGAGLAGVAFTLPLPFFFQATLSILWLMAFSSATHDIAADGFYMLALSSAQQSFFVGIRSTFYRLAMITGQGLLIILAGALESYTGMKPVSFTVESNPAHYLSSEFPDTNKTAGDTTGIMQFAAFPEKLVLNPQNTDKQEINRLKEFTIQYNRENGFVQSEKKTDVQKKSQSWWSKTVSVPLGIFIKRNFGEESSKDEIKDKTGNLGIICIRLNQKPSDEKNILLNFRMEKGDKSISITEGEQLVFTSKNWQKPAFVLVQLDYKLQLASKAQFVGTSGNLKLAWSITFFILSGVFILLALYHRYILPRPDIDHSSSAKGVSNILKEFFQTFASFFKKKQIGITLAFFLLYRLGESMLVKMVSPFLLDGREIGGLGLTTGQVGLVYGTVGIVALTIGGIFGGIAASRKGLKKMLWIMALCITLPHLTFLFLARYMPENFIIINTAVAVEQFGYGFGFTAYMLYMIYFSEGKNKTAHFAICTGFMALGMMLPGMIAGWLQELIGYRHFFIFIMICAIPTLLVIPFLRIDPSFGIKEKK